MWFSNYYGQNWTIDKGVNDRFAMEVRLIRDKFSTKKTSQTGRETSTTRVHIDTRSGPVEVILTNFVWDGFHQENGYNLPLFECRLIIFEKRNIPAYIRSLNRASENEELYQNLTFIEKMIGLLSPKKDRSNVSTPSSRSAKRYSDEKVIFNGEFRVEFKKSYPFSPPMIRMKDRKYHRITDHHEHHIYGGGVLCIFADSDDWDSSKSTALTAILVAVDWIVWHYEKFGKEF
jgi:hypothetical protein